MSSPPSLVPRHIHPVSQQPPTFPLVTQNSKGISSDDLSLATRLSVKLPPREVRPPKRAELTDLHHGNLIGHQPVADHNVALGDVQPLLSYAGGEEQIERPLAELADDILLFVLEDIPIMRSGWKSLFRS